MRRPFDDQSSSPGIGRRFCGYTAYIEFPAIHINYAETVLPMQDELPKFKDFPAEFGGSGEQLTDLTPLR
jgi:hypothetical protein